MTLTEALARSDKLPRAGQVALMKSASGRRLLMHSPILDEDLWLELYKRPKMDDAYAMLLRRELSATMTRHAAGGERRLGVIRAIMYTAAGDEDLQRELRAKVKDREALTRLARNPRVRPEVMVEIGDMLGEDLQLRLLVEKPHAVPLGAAQRWLENASGTYSMSMLAQLMDARPELVDSMARSSSASFRLSACASEWISREGQRAALWSQGKVRSDELTALSSNPAADPQAIRPAMRRLGRDWDKEAVTGWSSVSGAALKRVVAYLESNDAHLDTQAARLMQVPRLLANPHLSAADADTLVGRSVSGRYLPIGRVLIARLREIRPTAPSFQVRSFATVNLKEARIVFKPLEIIDSQISEMTEGELKEAAAWLSASMPDWETLVAIADQFEGTIVELVAASQAL